MAADAVGTSDRVITERQLRMTYELTELVATEDLAFDELLRRSAEIVCRGMADICVIALLSPDGERLHPLGLASRDPTQRARLEADVQMIWDPPGRILDRAISTGDPAIYSPDELQDAIRGEPMRQGVVAKWKTSSAMVVAMRTAGDLVGVVTMTRQGGSPAFSDQDIPFVQAGADVLALAVANHHLREEAGRLRHPEGDALPNPRLRELTPRELEILRLIGEGLTSREIGERLYLSHRTIEWHRGRLAAKLDEHHRSDLIALGRTLRS